jgi:hypothetical protein
MEDSYTGVKGFGWYYKLEFVANMLVSVAAVLSFLLYRKYFPAFVTFCYLSLIILVFLTSIHDLGQILKQPSFIYSIRGFGTFINFGLIFFAANTRYFKKLLNVFYAVCIAFIVAGLFNLSKVGMGASRQNYLYAIRDLTVMLIWVFPFFFLQEETDRRKNIFNLVIFFLIFIFVLCTGARTYLVIYAVYLGVKFKDKLSAKGGFVFLLGALISVVVVFYLLSGSALGDSIAGAFDVLAERKDEDSRSGQIIEFLNQWDTSYLLQGVGPFKKWYWTNVADYYYFLDNQFLLMGWWAGLPALFIYLYLLIRTFFTKPEILQFEYVRGIPLLIFFWILACLGFAIYITISSSIYYFFLDIMMGYHLCQFTKLKDPDFETT